MDRRRYFRSKRALFICLLVCGLTFEQFLDKMDKTDLYFNNFQKYIVANGLEIKLGKNKALVKRYLAAEFAQQLFDDEKYYEIVLKEDPMIKAVLTDK